MIPQPRFAHVLIALLAALAPPGSSSAISPQEFKKLHSELQPPADELWSSVPWEISIHKALVKAEKQRKPLFMWVMNGNPCGAT